MNKMQYITVETFKAETNTVGHKINFGISKNNKLIAVVNNGKTYKAQASLDVKKEVRFMYNEVEGFDNGCFVNVTPLKTKFSL